MGLGTDECVTTVATLLKKGAYSCHKLKGKSDVDSELANMSPVQQLSKVAYLYACPSIYLMNQAEQWQCQILLCWELASNANTATPKTPRLGSGRWHAPLVSPSLFEAFESSCFEHTIPIWGSKASDRHFRNSPSVDSEEHAMLQPLPKAIRPVPLAAALEQQEIIALVALGMACVAHICSPFPGS